MTMYTIKRTNGDQGFEVSAPDKEWVEIKAEAFAQELMTIKSAPKKSPKSRPKSSSKPTIARTKSGDKLESLVRGKLNNDIIARLVEYVGERQEVFNKTVTNQAVIIAKFLKDNLDIIQIDQQDLAYVYKQVGMWDVVNHRKQIDNAADTKKYFTRNSGKFELSYAGEKFAHDTARDKDEEAKLGQL